MSKYKVNSINGKSRRHSILRGLAPLVEGIEKDLSVKVHSCHMVNKKPRNEAIEIHEFNTNGNGNYIKILAYDLTSNKGPPSQYFKIFCHQYRFKEIVNYIISYSEKHPVKKNEIRRCS